MGNSFIQFKGAFIYRRIPALNAWSFGCILCTSWQGKGDPNQTVTLNQNGCQAGSSRQANFSTIFPCRAIKRMARSVGKQIRVAASTVSRQVVCKAGSAAPLPPTHRPWVPRPGAPRQGTLACRAAPCSGPGSRRGACGGRPFKWKITQGRRGEQNLPLC